MVFRSMIPRKPELANSVLDDRHRETLAILHHFAEVNPLSTDLPLQAPKLAHRRHPSLAPWQPAWWLLYNAPPEAWERLSSRSGRYVAKRLTPIRGAPPYTVEVDPARLSRSEPWWIEELIDSESELTVAMLPRGIGEFYFAADRPNWTPMTHKANPGRRSLHAATHTMKTWTAS